MYSSKLLSLQDPCVGVWGLMPVPKDAWLSFLFETGLVPSVPIQPSVVCDLSYLQFSSDAAYIQLIFTDMRQVNGVWRCLLLKRQGQQEDRWAVFTDANGVPLPIDPTLVTLQVWNGGLHVISGKTLTGLEIITNVTRRVMDEKTLQHVVQDMYSSPRSD
jgi:hypothetical protein